MRTSQPPGLWSLFLILVAFGCTKTDNQINELDAIIKVAKKYRGLKPRASGELPYVPYESDKLRKVTPDLDTFIDAEQVLAEINDDAVTTVTRRVQAFVDLNTVFGLEGVERALQELTAAASENPDDPHTLNDLAVANLIYAEESERPIYLLPAFKSIYKTLELAPKMLEAHYNKALILEQLYLREAADKAWEAYLQIDSGSEWADEALRLKQQNLGKIPPPFDPQPYLDTPPQTSVNDEPFYPYDLHVHVERHLLGAWGEAVLAEDQQEAERLLTQLKNAAAHLASGGLFQKAIGQFNNEDTTLAQAMIAFSQGKDAELVSDLKTMNASFNQVEKAIDQSNPLWWRTKYYQALCQRRMEVKEELKGKKSDLALRLFEELVPELKSRGYLNAYGETNWSLGVIHASRNKPYPSSDAYSIALNNFKSIGNITNEAGILSLNADTLLIGGDWEKAWAEYYQSLKLTDTVTWARSLNNIYNTGSAMIWEQGAPNLALIYQDLAVEYAEITQDIAALHGAYIWRGRYYITLNQFEKAGFDIIKGRHFFELAKKTNNELYGVSRLNWGLMNISEAEFFANSEADLAISKWTDVIDVYKKETFLFGMSFALNNRAKCWRYKGNLEKYNDDLKQVIELEEQLRTQIRNDNDRDYLYTRFASVYDDLIELNIQDQNYIQALDYYEARRGRVLYDRMRRSEDQSLSAFKVQNWEEWRNEIPDQTGLLIYRITEAGASAWIVDNQRTHYQNLDISPEHLELKVGNFLSQIQDNRKITENIRLYNDLLVPIIDELEAYERLVIVPDGPLHKLPFAALHDGDRYLIEGWTLSYAPSGNIYVKCLERSQQKTRRQPTVIAFGNPANPKGEDLPMSAEEAREVASKFENGRAYTGAEATASLFLNLAGSANIIHFAGHSGFIDYPNSDSYIILSSDGKHDGFLRTDELRNSDFIETGLVVLSSCDSSGHSPYLGEGSSALVNAMLIAGATSVVTSSWKVSDIATKDSVLYFYQNLLSGKDCALSLRDAQLTLLKAKVPTKVWAAFTVHGHWSLGL